MAIQRTIPTTERSTLDATYNRRTISDIPHITDVGEYDHEPIWLPYFVAKMESKEYDRVDNEIGNKTTYTFRLTVQEQSQFPEAPPIVRIRRPVGFKAREI